MFPDIVLHFFKTSQNGGRNATFLTTSFPATTQTMLPDLPIFKAAAIVVGVVGVSRDVVRRRRSVAMPERQFSSSFGGTFASADEKADRDFHGGFGGGGRRRNVGDCFSHCLTHGSNVSNYYLFILALRYNVFRLYQKLLSNQYVSVDKLLIWI